MKTSIFGKVIRGKGRGKKLGFPTVNIEIDDKDLESGVYEGKVTTRELGANGKLIRTNMWPAGIFIGKNKKILEAYLIDFSGDLYGKEIKVEIDARIRGVTKFENDEELKKQIEKDINKITRECGANEKRMRANEDLVYPELSYKLVGLAMEAHNKFGNIYQEKHYQKVFEEKLKQLGINYEREKKIIVETDDKCEIGEFFMDFVVDDKILLEFKRVNFIHYNDIKQVLRYLDAAELKLGIILNFKLNKLQYRRIINPRIRSY